MKTISVLQNTDSEHLGLIEDHLEGRNIRFRYIRPAHDSHWATKFELHKDGLIILGAAPYGTVSAPKLPLLEQRIKVIESCLAEKLPVVAFGTGTQLLMMACGNSVRPCELSLNIETAKKIDQDALNGHLPDRYPVVTYMRDVPLLPDEAQILSVTENEVPALFRIFGNCLGFIGHPGLKSAMIEDSIVQMPAFDVAEPQLLEIIRNRQSEIEAALISMMTGLIQITGWMR